MEKWTTSNRLRESTRPKSFIITIHVNGTKGSRDFPTVSFGVDKKEYLREKIDGEKKIEFRVDSIKKRNVLYVEMLNKTPKDTKVVDGKIVSDMNLKINKIIIDEVNIRNHIFNCRQKPAYHEQNQGPKTVSSDFIFFSGKWKLYFENPPRLYYANMRYSTALINDSKKQERVKFFKDKLYELFIDNKSA